MNKYFNFFVVMILVVAFASCSRSKNIATSETIQRQWMLKTLPGVSYDELLKARAEINLTDLKATGAFGGCNRIFFTTQTGAKHSITFTNIGSTKMYCEGNMKVEDALAKSLSQITQYQLIAPHQVAFKDGNGKTIITAVAADWD